MFYCTNSKKAVFYELNAQVGERFLLSTWNNGENYLLLNNIGYTKENLTHLGASDERLTYDIPLESNNDENKFLNEYLSQKFNQRISNEILFKLTNAIAQLYFSEIEESISHKFHDFDGLVYPTIKFKANADNMALKPRIIDSQKLNFERAEFIEITNYENGQYGYRIFDIANSIKEDKIKWENLTNTWTVTDESDDIYFVDGLAYNQEGDIISPD